MAENYSCVVQSSLLVGCTGHWCRIQLNGGKSNISGREDKIHTETMKLPGKEQTFIIGMETGHWRVNTGHCLVKI